MTAMMRIWIKFCALSFALLSSTTRQPGWSECCGRQEDEPAGGCSELNEEANHEGGEEEETGKRAELGDEFRERVKLKLQRRLLCVPS